MVFDWRNTAAATLTALFSALMAAVGGDVNSDYITPPSTFSPDHRYGVTIPVFHVETAEQADHRKNKVVDLRTGDVIAILHADPPGYDRALNHHEASAPHWSSDSSLLLWKIGGKWCPDALILLKIEQNRAKWRLDLLRTAQHAVLSRTREAAPDQYKLCRRANAGNGSAYPDGFTIDVTTDGEDSRTIALPLGVHADLTANPKQIEGDPNLDSQLDGLVNPKGKFVVTSFSLVRVNHSRPTRRRSEPVHVVRLCFSRPKSLSWHRDAFSAAVAYAWSRHTLQPCVT